MSTAEQIIAEHTLEWIGHQCVCGEQFTTGKTYRDGMGVLRQLHAAHVVAALTNAGHVVMNAGLLGDLGFVLERAVVDGGDVTPSLERLVRFHGDAVRAAARVAEGGDQP
ncbi:hypothetical protein A5N78_04615 [Prescottella equi]|uniref:hypothetical protein n=1 Tax=Rhodococcus hoagii TaxID=43767 RepID=UPI000A10BEFC|nr:hypothetical protein [Prescottella equi]ORL93423.1 hypothetical protein A5N78_04615 [Prescottella equi]ORM17776.1 hypothetical protein A5N70_11190 [Prescottella equi]